MDRASRRASRPELFSAREEQLLVLAARYVGVALTRALALAEEHALIYSADAMVNEMLPAHVATQLKQRLVASDAASREFVVDHHEHVFVLFSEVRRRSICSRRRSLGSAPTPHRPVLAPPGDGRSPPHTPSATDGH